MWRGAVDAEGLPHGRGTLTLGKRARFEGRMAHGSRDGVGCLIVDEGASDSEDGDDEPALSTLRVRWRRDAPWGAGVFTEPDGATVHGVWEDGELRGAAHERHADGSVRYVGAYGGGVRDGVGVEVRADGGALAGTWRGGQLHGDRCAYLFPCADGGALVGEWRDGRMARAFYTTLAAAPAPSPLPAVARPLPAAAAVHPALPALLAAAAASAPSLPLPRRDPRAEAYSFGSAGQALPNPCDRRAVWLTGGFTDAALAAKHLEDPHESARVVARDGPAAAFTLDDRGNSGALFARRPLAAGEVAAFFHGLAGWEDGRPADYSACGAEDGEERRVPDEHGAWSDRYCATLGHRARHAGWRANCKLEPFEHPRFGPALCVRVGAGGGVAAGTELTVDYAHLADLKSEMRPRWYIAHVAQRNEDGYYAQLRLGPPSVLYSAASSVGHGAVEVRQHGPWRVLWFERVEQGMTYHAADGSLVPEVVGFDYQRTMVAAAAALLTPAVRGGGGVSSGFAGPRGTWYPSAVLVGFGAGSCAAALGAWGGAALRVAAVELDPAVVAAVRAAHGVRIFETSLRSATDHPLSRARPKPHDRGASEVTVVDAATYVRTAPPGSIDALLLDAYDSEGRVPAHLQAERFVRDAAAALSPGGVVVANLFDSSEVARAESKAFSRRLRQAIGPVFALRVVGHEANIILLAIKSFSDDGGASDGTSLDAVRRRLAAAAEPEGAAAVGGRRLDPAVVACMRSNAETCRRFEL